MHSRAVDSHVSAIFKLFRAKVCDDCSFYFGGLGTGNYYHFPALRASLKAFGLAFGLLVWKQIFLAHMNDFARYIALVIGYFFLDIVGVRIRLGHLQNWFPNSASLSQVSQPIEICTGFFANLLNAKHQLACHL